MSVIINEGLLSSEEKAKIKAETKELSINEQKELLKQESNLEECERYTQGLIWIDNTFHDNEEKIKAHNKELLKICGTEKLFFLAHHKDEARGKPEFFGEYLQTLPLVQRYHVIEKNSKGQVKEEYDKYFLLGERADKRYDGYPTGNITEKFRLYKLTQDHEQVIILIPSKLGELPNEILTFKGMKMKLDDLQEMTKNLKVKKITNLFLVHSFESTVQILSKEELIQVTSELKRIQGFGHEEFKELLQTHPNGNIYPLSEEADALRIARILSGKKDGYPLHLHIIGPAGTGKTTILEQEQQLFQEQQEILEGANTTPKGLQPSFKEIPADIGFLARCNRVALVDELFKMVQNQINKERQASGLYLYDLNFLLEHKNRTVASGNKNSCTVQATSKCLFCSNPLGNKVTLAEHLRTVDPSFMSRMINWVQNEEEVKSIFSKERVRGSANTTTSIYPYSYSKDSKKIGVLLKLCSRKDEGNFNPFLTIYDTCQTFLSTIDDQRIKQIIDKVSSKAKEPLKSSIWIPRAEHHTYLIVDGLCKFRCLFKDYDVSFIAKDEDYQLTEAILTRMVEAWDTNLLPKEERR